MTRLLVLGLVICSCMPIAYADYCPPDLWLTVLTGSTEPMTTRKPFKSKPVLLMLVESIAEPKAGDLVKDRNTYRDERWDELADAATDLLIDALEQRAKNPSEATEDPSLAELEDLFHREKNSANRRSAIQAQLQRTRVKVGGSEDTFYNIWTAQAEGEWDAHHTNGVGG